MPTTPDSKAAQAFDATETIERAVCEGNRIDFNAQLRMIDLNAPSRVTEKIVSLKGWLDVLFNARKYERHGDGLQGREFARQQALADLERIKNIIRVGEAEDDEPERG